MLPLSPRLVDISPTEVLQLHMQNYLSGFAKLCRGASSRLEFQVQGPFQQGTVPIGD